MTRRTWKKKDGSWGLAGAELGKVEPAVYAALWKLMHLEDLMEAEALQAECCGRMCEKPEWSREHGACEDCPLQALALREKAAREDLEASELSRRKNMQWTPVEEAVPEEGEFVLVRVCGQYESIRMVGALCIAAHYEDGWELEGWPEWAAPGVTHWMALPEGSGEAE